MTHPETNSPHQGGAASRPSWSLVALIAGATALALVLAVFIGYRAGSDGTAGLAASADGATAPVSTESSPEPEPESAPSPSSTTDEAEEGDEGDELPTARGDLPPMQPPSQRGMLHVPPVHVEIPAIDVSSTLVDLGLNPDNSLEVPADYAKAGWYTGGAYPGDSGGPPALIVGHVDNKEGPAVFYELNQLVVGDEIMVERSDGTTAVFVVYDARQYPKNSLPTDEIYSDRDGSELVLITCTGDFDAAAGSYLDNYVVTARLDPEASGLQA